MESFVPMQSLALGSVWYVHGIAPDFGTRLKGLKFEIIRLKPPPQEPANKFNNAKTNIKVIFKKEDPHNTDQNHYFVGVHGSNLTNKQCICWQCIHLVVQLANQ